MQCLLVIAGSHTSEPDVFSDCYQSDLDFMWKTKLFSQFEHLFQIFVVGAIRSPLYLPGIAYSHHIYLVLYVPRGVLQQGPVSFSPTRFCLHYSSLRTRHPKGQSQLLLDWEELKRRTLNPKGYQREKEVPILSCYSSGDISLFSSIEGWE